MNQCALLASDAEDLRLMARCRAGDAGALRELFDRHQRRVFNVALRIVNNVEDAEEIVTEVFLRVWTRSHSFQGRSRVTTWLHQIAANLSVDRIRAMNSRRSLSLDALAGTDAVASLQSDERSQPEQACIREEESAQLHQAISQLTSEDRMLVTLYHLEGCSYEEIREITGISLTNIKSKLFRARRRLRNMLSASYQEADDELLEDTAAAGRLQFRALQPT